jgi:hypothetical protein
MTKIHHRPIVEYTGTITDMHGLWRIEGSGERLTLVSAYGLTLRYVRRANVTPVAAPPLTRIRAEALRDLADHRLRPVTRVWNWLVCQKLAELDAEDGRPRATRLGFELADALLWW